MAIDMHSHYYGGLVDSLRRRKDRPFVAPDASGRDVLHAMTASTVMAPGYVDPAARLAWMDAAGITTQLMTFPGALGVDVMPGHEVEGMIVDFNDHLADLCRGSGGRFAGLAGLPLDDIAVAAREMTRARSQLGLAGAILPGNFFLTAADAERLRPVFAAANETGALLMVHPGLMPGEDPPAAYPDNSILRASALNLQASIAQMALTLVMGSFLEDYPDVTVQVVNLGGTLPFILERVEAVARSRGVAFPAERLRRMVYDTASLGPRAIETAAQVLGSDRLMLGTDYPIFQPAAPLADVLQARLGEVERAHVRQETAATILRRLGVLP
jgi:aminocarboxymuconate-semialdehyde decarboxylase